MQVIRPNCSTHLRSKAGPLVFLLLLRSTRKNHAPGTWSKAGRASPTHWIWPVRLPLVVTVQRVSSARGVSFSPGPSFDEVKSGTERVSSEPLRSQPGSTAKNRVSLATTVGFAHALRNPGDAPRKSRTLSSHPGGQCGQGP